MKVIETKYGFDITEKRLMVWNIEKELLLYFEKICKEENFEYWAIAGTLLGAVRHSGFIPWDDDIDLVMMRKDYNKLRDLAQKYNNEKYFIQSWKNEENYCWEQIRIRNSNTTAIEVNEIERKNWKTYNHGIFIDIFPLDSVPNNAFKKIVQIKKLSLLKKIIQPGVAGVGKRTIVKDFICLLLMKFTKIVGYEKLYKYREKLSTKYNKKNTKDIGIISNFPNLGDRMIWSRNDFYDSIKLDFDNLKINVPSGYKNILAKQYGDWKKYKYGGSLHEGMLFDVENSYKLYFENRNKINDLIENGKI